MDVTLTNHTATVFGKVSPGAGSTTVPDDVTVVVLSTDDGTWGLRSRHVFAVPMATDGTFSVMGLLPGEYVAVAVQGLELGEETDPARLATWRGKGRRVVVHEDERALIGLDAVLSSAE